MREFWQHLKAAWNFGRVFPYVEAADADDFWSREDASALNVFFQSYTGQKFKVRLRNFTIQTAVAEARDMSSPRGKAMGAMAAVAYMEAHFPQPGQEEEPDSVETLETVEA